MAGHALANRCERVACELFEHVVEAMHGFLGECPRDCGIVTGGAFDARDVEERAGSESYLSSGDGRERNVDSEQVGREGLASKFIGLRMPSLLWSKSIC